MNEFTAKFKLGEMKYGELTLDTIIEFENKFGDDENSNVNGVVVINKISDNSDSYYGLFYNSHNQYHPYNWISPALMMLIKKLPYNPDNLNKETIEELTNE